MKLCYFWNIAPSNEVRYQQTYRDLSHNFGEAVSFTLFVSSQHSDCSWLVQYFFDMIKKAAIQAQFSNLHAFCIQMGLSPTRSESISDLTRKDDTGLSRHRGYCNMKIITYYGEL